ncbi:hypothetical protein BDF20DRAFT_904750 [Mycotypha africana]|uniref:uncharacterized protein n=1 Tax=Mycotypha africana TaxID=64632 RepID=UPI0023007487|nr:uncharacterized protein BDF20DRAFT_904750 [Mycotypha africana]KAI8987852.1 hypothetical protein BDF20DRAFT_904750 [Mycotypha africana]
MTLSVPGEQFIRTLRQYLEANEGRLLLPQSTLNLSQPPPPVVVRESVEDSPSLIRAFTSLWSSNASDNRSLSARSVSSSSMNDAYNNSARQRSNPLNTIPFPYMSLLGAASPETTAIANIPYIPQRSCLTLDIHYLYFLLVQFEQLGLEEGGESPLPVPANGLVETETTSNMTENAHVDRKPPSIMSVGSVMSTLSLSTGWQFWSNKKSALAAERPLHEDIIYIHRYLSKVTSLRLHMNLMADTQGKRVTSQRTIRGYEQPLSQDGSIVLPLHCFKSLKFLELSNTSPRCVDLDSVRPQLTSLIIKSGSVDNAIDIIKVPAAPVSPSEATIASDKQSTLSSLWPNLKMLSLQDNSLTTIDDELVQHIRSVTHLNLSSNLLIDIPSALSLLFNLTSLNLSHNMISFITGINTVLGNIQELDLRGNRLTVLAGLDRLWALERLDIRDNRIEDSAEVGRLTPLPNIHDIWVEGNPFTKLQDDYRIEIFNVFKKNDLDIQLDGTKPTFAERRRIKTPAPSPSASSNTAAVNIVRKPDDVTTTSTATTATKWPTPQTTLEDKSVDSSAKANKLVRAKTKNNKRQVRLGQAKTNGIPEAAFANSEESSSNKKHVHRLADLEDAVQYDAKVANKATSVQSRKSKKNTKTAEKSSLLGSSDHASNGNLATTNGSSTNSSEAFRKRIEAMRKEAGTEWLRVLQEMDVNTLMKSFVQRFTYNLALWIFNIMLTIFFREVRSRGSHKIPKEGPVIFVAAPHANQFVDPIILMRECRRSASFLIAEKSMHEKGIGTFARMIGAIPVIRPQDLAKPGQGRIQLLNRKTDPLRITGIDTQFTKQLRPKDSIVLPKGVGVSEIDKVISDTEVLIKREFKELKALEVLTRSEGTAYKCMPHVEQDKVYKAVHKELNDGGCITIFPEGGSHDRAAMLPLKAGVTLMALGAMAKYDGLDVKIVPCGLNYFHAHRFRSRAVIEFGSPITVSSELVQKFKAGGASKREACSTLLDNIYNALKTVTINAGSYETLMLIQAARRLYKPAHTKLHLSQVVDLNRRFLIGYNVFKDDPKVNDLEQKVMAYNQLLKYYGIKDHQVNKTTTENNGRLLYLLMKRISILIFLGLWSFPGAILNLPVVIVAKLISEKKAKAALKSSTVKIAGRDVLATWKLLVGLVLIPTLYATYSLVMFVVVLQTDLAFKWKLLIPFAVWCCLPFVSYASMKFGEIGHDIFKSIKPTIMALMDPQGAETLRQSREKLSVSITELINEYGPKVFPDFDANYISRSIEISPTTITASSRTTSTGSLSWTSAPSKLPKIASGFFQQVTRMNWLDDKNIFNWTRTDDSDMADDVFFFLDKFYNNISGRSRSGSISGGESSRNRSRSNSISSIGSNEGFIKVEAMTIHQNHTANGEITEKISEESDKQLRSRRSIFRIDDIEEDTEEVKIGTFPKEGLVEKLLDAKKDV